MLAGWHCLHITLLLEQLGRQAMCERETLQVGAEPHCCLKRRELPAVRCKQQAAGSSAQAPPRAGPEAETRAAAAGQDADKVHEAYKARASLICVLLTSGCVSNSSLRLRRALLRLGRKSGSA